MTNELLSGEGFHPVEKLALEIHVEDRNRTSSKTTSTQRRGPLIQEIDHDDNNDRNNNSNKEDHDADDDDDDDDEPPPVARLSLMEQMMMEASMHVDEEKNAKTITTATTTTTTTTVPTDQEKTRKNKTSKSGFKKGFLLSSSTKTKNKSSSSSSRNLRTTKTIDKEPVLQTIKPMESKNKNTNTNPLYLSEVQESMKQNEATAAASFASFHHPTKNDDFMTDVMESKPHLVQALQDPIFIKALEMIQSNPSQAKTIFRANPSIAVVLQEFCGLLGLHFTKLGEMTNTENTSTDTNTSSTTGDDIVATTTTTTTTTHPFSPSSSIKTMSNKPAAVVMEMMEQEKEVHELLFQKHPEIQHALMDPNMKRIMEECSSYPGRMHYYMAHPEYGPKLRSLVRAGLLQVV